MSTFASAATHNAVQRIRRRKRISAGSCVGLTDMSVDMKVLGGIIQQERPGRPGNLSSNPTIQELEGSHFGFSMYPRGAVWSPMTFQVPIFLRNTVDDRIWTVSFLPFTRFSPLSMQFITAISAPTTI